MRKPPLSILWFISFIALTSSAYGQVPIWPFERVDNGQLSANIQAVYQDSYGFLWLGTDDGVFSYDGLTFDHYVYKPYQEASLPHPRVQSIVESADKSSLWVGTIDGLARIQREGNVIETFRHDPLNPDSSLSNNTVNALVKDGEGQIWVGTSNGLTRIDPETHAMTAFRNSENDQSSIQNEDITALYVDHSNRLWIGTRSSFVEVLDLATGEFETLRVAGDGYEVRTMHAYQDSLLLGFNVAEGLPHKMVALSMTTREHSAIEGDGLDTVTGITNDAQGNLWIGTTTLDGKLLRFAADDRVLYQINDSPYSGITDNNFRSLYYSNSGVLWVGTYEGHLYKYRDQSLVSNATLSGATANVEQVQDIYAVLKSSSGDLWLGTLGNGLFRVKDDFTEHVDLVLQTKGIDETNLITDLAEDSNGIIWIATFGGGLVEYDSISKRVLRHRVFDAELDGIAGLANHIFDITIADDGLIWLATNGAGLLQYDPGSNAVKQFVSEDLLYLTSVLEVSSSTTFAQGDMLVSGMRGVYLKKANEDSLTTYVPDFQEHVLDMEMDAEGNLWLGLYGGGLIRFNDRQLLKRFTAEVDGLPSNTITNIVLGIDNTLLIAGDKGISKLTDLSSERPSITSVTQPLGALERYSENSVSLNGDMLYAGGPKGAYSILDLNETFAEPTPRIVLRDKDGKLYDNASFPQEIKIGAALDSSIEVLVLDYWSPHSNVCNYQIVGVHDSPFPCDQIGSTIIKRSEFLDENGEVELLVQVNDGFHSLTESFSLRVTPQWWQKTSTKVLFGGIFLALGGIIFRLGMAIARQSYERKDAYVMYIRELEARRVRYWLHDIDNELMSLSWSLDDILSDKLLEKDTFARIQVIKDYLMDLHNIHRDGLPHFEFPDLDQGLSAAISKDVVQLPTKASSPSIQLQLLSGPDDMLPSSSRLSLFLIYKLALQNALRHAEAKQITIEFERSKHLYSLRIVDDGKGFKLIQPENEDNRKGIGLELIEAYATEAGASYTIDSEIGKGTSVLITIKNGIGIREKTASAKSFSKTFSVQPRVEGKKLYE